MNKILRMLKFWPTFNHLLKGGLLYKERKYEAAINRLIKCFNHPRFENEMLYSYYGLSHFHLGRKEEALTYLKMAHECYEENNWQLDNEHDFDLANEVVNALEDLGEGKITS